MYISENSFESFDVYDAKGKFLATFETEDKAYAYIIMKERENA